MWLFVVRLIPVGFIACKIKWTSNTKLLVGKEILDKQNYLLSVLELLNQNAHAYLKKIPKVSFKLYYDEFVCCILFH